MGRKRGRMYLASGLMKLISLLYIVSGGQHSPLLFPICEHLNDVSTCHKQIIVNLQYIHITWKRLY